MKKVAILFAALAAMTTAQAVSVWYYMGDTNAVSAAGYVDPYNASSPKAFTVTNTPAGWKITDWFTAKSPTDIAHQRTSTSMGVSSPTYTWPEYSTANALAVRFDPISYTISFDPNGGAAFSGQGPYLSTNEVSLLEYTGTREGYHFAGWTNEYVTTAIDHNTAPFTGIEMFGLGNADTNIVLHAAWTANVYTVTFGYAKDAAGGWTNAVQYVRYGENAVPPSKETVDVWLGWHFTGWNGTYTAVTAPQEVEALYAPNVYTVAYDPNCADASGEMANNSFTYGESGALSENQFSRAGYTFGGWNTKPDGSGSSYRDGATVRDLTGVNHATVTLYAQWLPIPYTIAFDGGEDAVGEMPPTNVLYGQEVTLPTNCFVRQGWTFGGWDCGNGVVVPDGATVSNLTATADATNTLVAVWGDYHSELSSAMHCMNLQWFDTDDDILSGENHWIARFGEGLGHNGSGSCAEQSGMASKTLTAAVATNGVLSFYCRNVSLEQATLDMSINRDESHFTRSASVKSVAILDPETGWQFIQEEIDLSQIIDVGEGEAFVHFATRTGTIQIDQMKWEPEGGEPGEINLDVSGYSGKYDGVAHGVAVGGTNGIEDVECMYATGDTVPADADGWSADAPTFVDVGTAKVWCVASAPGYVSVTGSATVAISPREVTLTSGSASKEYDGSPVLCADVYVGGDGFADGEGATYDVTGSQTDAGSSANTFTYTLNENTKASNYSITTTPGTLKVTKASYDMSGVAWDYSDPFEYDGRRKTVSLVGLPDGLSVSYAGNSATRPGKYEAVATFTSASPNYETPMEMSREWEIVASGGPVIPGEGTVTEPKKVQVGKKATWKAKAAKGSVFAHWEGEAVDALDLSNNELRNPTLQFVVPEDFDADGVEAVFIAVDSDGLSSLWLSSDEVLDLGAAVDGLELLDDSESYVTASVGGLPSGLKFDKKTLKITGAPKKSGAFIVKITAKNGSGYKWAENVVLKVKNADGSVPPDPAVVPEPKRTMYYPLTTISSELSAGTVSGTGVYADGKKASISAKPAKGYVFAGWYCDDGLTVPMAFASGDYRKASQSVVVPEVRYLYAKFVKATDDPVSGLAAKGSGLDAETKRFAWRVGVAVGDDDGVEFKSASLPTSSAKGLPSGVKFNAATGLFTGVPTKAGSYTATVTVKNASKSTATLPVGIDVAALDEWAQGTFNGAVFQGDAEGGGFVETALPTGLVTLTVSSTGKIGGKILEGGKTWSLSAASFSRVEHVERVEDGLAYYATVIAKSGKEVATNEIEIVAEETGARDARPYRGVATGTLSPNPQTLSPNPSLSAYQNLWKVEPWKTEAKKFSKAQAISVPVGGIVDAALPDAVTLKFASSGAVTAKLGSYSCSSVLIPTVSDNALDTSHYALFLYFAPKANKFDGYSAEVRLEWDGSTFKSVEE